MGWTDDDECLRSELLNLTSRPGLVELVGGDVASDARARRRSVQPFFDRSDEAIEATSAAGSDGLFAARPCVGYAPVMTWRR